MFIKWLPVWGNRKKCWTSDLTVIWQASESKIFNWLKETIAHYKGFLQCKKPLKKDKLSPRLIFRNVLVDGDEVVLNMALLIFIQLLKTYNYHSFADITSQEER